MLKRYEIKRPSKLLAVLNFILASFIVYTINSAVVYYFENEVEARKPDSYVVRVVGNSNSEQDQLEKQRLAQLVEQQIQPHTAEPVAVTAQRLYTQLQQHYPHSDWQVAFGPQLIPPKIVDNRLYPQVETEAIVVKIGQGRGDNWFCAIFPNTCEPEFDEQDDEEPPRKSLFKQLWDWIFSS